MLPFAPDNLAATANGEGFSPADDSLAPRFAITLSGLRAEDIGNLADGLQAVRDGRARLAEARPVDYVPDAAYASHLARQRQLEADLIGLHQDARKIAEHGIA